MVLDSALSAQNRVICDATVGVLEDFTCVSIFLQWSFIWSFLGYLGYIGSVQWLHFSHWPYGILVFVSVHLLVVSLKWGCCRDIAGQSGRCQLGGLVILSQLQAFELGLLTRGTLKRQTWSGLFDLGKDRKGDRPLHLAATRGDYAVIPPGLQNQDLTVHMFQCKANQFDIRVKDLKRKWLWC